MFRPAPERNCVARQAGTGEDRSCENGLVKARNGQARHGTAGEERSVSLCFGWTGKARIGAVGIVEAGLEAERRKNFGLSI